MMEACPHNDGPHTGSNNADHTSSSSNDAHNDSNTGPNNDSHIDIPRAPDNAASSPSTPETSDERILTESDVERIRDAFDAIINELGLPSFYDGKGKGKGKGIGPNNEPHIGPNNGPHIDPNNGPNIYPMVTAFARAVSRTWIASAPTPCRSRQRPSPY